MQMACYLRLFAQQLMQLGTAKNGVDALARDYHTSTYRDDYANWQQYTDHLVVDANKALCSYYPTATSTVAVGLYECTPHQMLHGQAVLFCV